eukprot:1160540-Pelagomonas_calceolata.AAC.6
MSPHTVTGARTGVTLDSSASISFAFSHNDFTSASANVLQAMSASMCPSRSAYGLTNVVGGIVGVVSQERGCETNLLGHYSQVYLRMLSLHHRSCLTALL